MSENELVSKWEICFWQGICRMKIARSIKARHRAVSPMRFWEEGFVLQGMGTYANQRNGNNRTRFKNAKRPFYWGIEM